MQFAEIEILMLAVFFPQKDFIRQFRRVIGMTPSRYGMERRIAVAAQWLAESEDEFKIDEIAEATGFTDRFHFSGAFKAHFGTPTGLPHWAERQIDLRRRELFRLL